MKDDLISRAEVIEKVNAWTYDMRDPEDSWAAEHEIKSLPSAQPEPCEDCVSRKSAIRLLHSGYHSKSMIEEVRELPSAQPKPLTESEVIICKLYLDDLDKYKTCNEYKLLMGLLDGTAFAQPEIIHCKDCRWQKDQSGSTAWLPCRAIVTPSDFYCGRAERRTDEPEK